MSERSGEEEANMRKAKEHGMNKKKQ